jgi:Glycosyl hydrolase catalytic core
MVPATMCRSAMVAVLCAVAVFAVLMSTPAARADEPVPLGQDPSSEVQATEADAAGDQDPLPGDWLGDGWSGHDWSTDDLPWTEICADDDPFPGEDTLLEDWLATVCAEGLPWDEWSWDDPADASPAEAAPAEGTPTDPAPADDSSSREAVTTDAVTAEATADTLMAATTTLATDVLAAPTMSVSGTTVSWTPTSGVSSYVFARKVPGQATQYSTVPETSVTPPAVAGTTVSYGVRTNVTGSAWADEVSITYPAVTVDPKTAPKMAVSGNTVSWTAIPGVSSYVFARKVPGQATQYSTVTGTSVTPPVVAGTTVDYGVRTNVTGSYWASEVSIAYPASPTSSPPPAPQPIDGTFQMGVVAGSALSYELSFLKSLGAHTARLQFGIGTSASNMASVIDAYARAGIRPLLMASFHGRLPTIGEAQNLGSWAAAYGPGGTFWQGKTYPANTAVTHIELGNETSYSYQFADNTLATYAIRAQTYALRARDAANAIRGANPRVGLVVQGDNAVNGTAWVSNVMRAVPTLDDLIAGWTIHPYGPNWATRIDSTINSARTAGARDLPIWITEWGLSSDNGRCLSDNYGWNKCMTYSGAASTLHNVLVGMQSRYATRLGAFFLYQAHDQYATGTQTGREAYFGALQSKGLAKGAYTTEVKANLAVN